MKPSHRINRGLALVTLLLAGVEQAGATEAASGLVDQVREAELGFAEALARRDREAFAGYIAEDAVFFGGASTHSGPAEVLEGWSAYFDPEGPRLTWKPARIEGNEPRGPAVSTGPYTLTIPAAGDDKARTLEGTYFSVWRINDRGEWKVIFDTGTAPETAVGIGEVGDAGGG